jgi:hypothetical protein
MLHVEQKHLRVSLQVLSEFIHVLDGGRTTITDGLAKARLLVEPLLAELFQVLAALNPNKSNTHFYFVLIIKFRF